MTVPAGMEFGRGRHSGFIEKKQSPYPSLFRIECIHAPAPFEDGRRRKAGNMSIQWKSSLALVLCIFALGACAGWKPVDGCLRGQTYSVAVPDGWMRFDTDAYVMISHDGPFLQYVLVQERPLEQPFRYTRKTFATGMLPSEAARIVIDDLKADPAVAGFEILVNEPAVIDDRDGFKLVFRYRNRSGLPLRTAYYGFIQGARYYSLRYTSAERHYYEKHVTTFEQIRRSFHLAVN